MANLPEVIEFTAGIYQIETSDPVLGGVNGVTNVPLKALTNRTAWLKGQVDSLNTAISSAVSAATLQAELNKLSYKAPALAATTTNITLSGLQTIDGVALVVGNRVLVRAQSTAAQNGIYLAQTSAWTRAEDMNADTEIQPGVAVVVTSGTTYADTVWTLSTDGTITIGTSAQAWRCLTENTALLGVPTAPTATFGTSTTQIATTAFVAAQTAPLAPLASPTFTGNPAAPTPAQFDDDTSVATTAFVQRALGNAAGFIGVTTNTTLTAAEAGDIIYASTSAGAITLTLPGAAALKAGSKYEIYNTGISDVIVTRSGADTIVVSNTTNTVTSVTLKAGDSIELINLGAGTLWYHAGGTAQMKNASGQFGASLATNGWQRLPSGLIIQWGQVGSITANGTVPVTFPISFPAAIASITTGLLEQVESDHVKVAIKDLTTSGFIMLGDGATGTVPGARWIAIGY